MRHSRRLGVVFSAVLLFVVCAYLNAGSEWMRELKGTLKTVEDFTTRGRPLYSPPWRVLQLYVSQDGDEHLFYEYTRMVLGESIDARYVAGNTQGGLAPTDAQVAAVAARYPADGKLHLPYRDVYVAYPPVAFAVMLLPRLVTDTLAGYRLAFGWLMCLFYVGAIGLGYRMLRSAGSAPPVSAWLRTSALLCLAMGPLVVGRYDLVPALFTLVALFFFARGQALAAGVFVALGVGTKMYPLLLLPTWLAVLWGLGGEARKTCGRFLLLAAAAGCTLLVLGGFVLFVSGRHVPIVSDLILFRARPFQLESTVGGLALLVLGPGAVTATFGSFNVESPFLAKLAQIWEPLTVCVLLGVAALALRWAGARAAHGLSSSQLAQALCAWTAAALLVLLCTVKVFSPQYLYWAVPLMLMMPRRRGQSGRLIARLFIAALVMTQLLFPTLYGHLRGGVLPVVLLLIARNALLFYLALVSIRAAQDIGASDDESPSLSPSLSTREALEPASAARLREAPDQVA